MLLTSNRREWLPRAIHCFQQQTYPSHLRGLLIVSDALDVRDLLPDDLNLHHVHLDRQLCIGEKRNFAIGMAEGEFLAHWDDDDWSAPSRLHDQVSRLIASGCAVTGYRSMRFEGTGQQWQYEGASDFALGTSLCYRREWAQSHPFPAKQVGEDNDFVAEAARWGQLSTVPADGRMVASIHSGNTSPRQLSGPQWHAL